MSLAAVLRDIAAPESEALSPRQRRRRFRGGGRTAALAAGAVAAVVVALACRGAPPVEAPPPVKPAAKNPWVEVVRPMPLYAMETTDFGREPRLYQARRHESGGGQHDILSFGPAGIGSAPVLHIDLYREGAEEVASVPFYVDIARQAAQAGLSIVRSEQPGPLPTRFGTFEAADVMLKSDGVEAACLGFRMTAGEARFQIAGFACGGARPIDRPTLACALERLDLVAAREDDNLTRFFLAAEKNRGQFCNLRASAASNAKSDWLDPRALPPPMKADAPHKKKRR